MNFIFSIFPLMFSLVFMLVFGVILYTIFRTVKQEHHNNHSPRLTVEAKVVAKRSDFHHGTSVNNHTGHSYTNYFVTFEVESGDRMELQVQGHEYGILVEGDFGEVSFQGKRYLAFQRKE